MVDLSSYYKTSLHKEIKYHEFRIHLTIESEIFPKTEEDDTQCICHNHLIETKDNAENIYHETEIIPSVIVPEIKDGKIKIVDIINKLRLMGFPMTGSLINLYMKHQKDFVFIGADPIDSNIVLDNNEVEATYLDLKIINYIEKEQMQHKIIPALEEKKEEVDEKKKDRRTKERKIGFIIEKVNAWRKLYNGFYNEKGEHTRYSLDQAADIIDISKKSLDDYLLQLRLGRKYGFDFNKNQNERVGVLRVYVKTHRRPDNKDK